MSNVDFKNIIIRDIYLTIILLRYYLLLFHF
jgi:hypothetical protein